MIRHLFVAAVLGASMPTVVYAQKAASEAAPDAAELAEARAIIAVMFPPSTRDAQMQSMLATMTAQTRQSLFDSSMVSDPGLKAILDRFMDRLPETLMPTVREHFPDILEATAVAYTHEFSLEELKEIRAFSSTPAGSHYFGKATSLLGDPAVAAANQRYFAALKTLQGKEIVKLQQEVVAYVKAHPEVAAKLKGGK